jgi:hypothetical protein
VAATRSSCEAKPSHIRSGAQGEFEGKALPLIGAVPNGAADYRSGGDRTKEPKATQSAERGAEPPTGSRSAAEATRKGEEGCAAATAPKRSDAPGRSGAEPRIARWGGAPCAL